MKEPIFDVIIVGYGPGGLTLGSELAFRGIKVLIIDKNINRTLKSRAFGLSPLTLDMFDMRGIANKFIDIGIPCHFIPIGDGKSFINFKHANTNFPFLLSINQEVTEKILEQWALDCGTKIENGVEFIDCKQSESYVHIKCKKDNKNLNYYSKYIVGCDGAYSKVRDIANISCSFYKNNKSLMHGDVKLNNPPKYGLFGKINKKGMVSVAPLNNGLYRVIIIDHNSTDTPISVPLSLKEFKNSAVSIVNQDFGMQDSQWLSRFRSQQKHAFKYQSKRIFLLGDAAHTHMPAGGQGLQVAIHDAFNLGWKLAAVINKRANSNFLRSYEKERRFINELAMRRSKIMFRYEVANSIFNRVIKWTVNKLIRINYLEHFIINDLSGLYTNYRKNFLNNKDSINNNYKHKMLGSYARDALLSVNGKIIRLYEAMRKDKFVVVDSYHNENIYQILKSKFENQIIYSTIISPKLLKNNVSSYVVRPDGVISNLYKYYNTYENLSLYC